MVPRMVKVNNGRCGCGKVFSGFSIKSTLKDIPWHEIEISVTGDDGWYFHQIYHGSV
jgi:fumarylacetoacetate (FAA) hydrolase family protein